MKSDNVILTGLVTTVILVVVIVYTTFAYAYVATVLYNWFILPNFVGIMSISYLQFVGIMTFKNVLQDNEVNVLKDEFKKDSHLFIFWLNCLGRPWLLLVCSYIVKWWFFN